MKKISRNLHYIEIESLDGLEDQDKSLVNEAIDAASKSYSPYSKFPVGAAVLLDSGEVFIGNNQENLSFPAGTCAERTVINYVHANYPEKKIVKLAITAPKSTSSIPVTPCGICRQVISEIESIQKHPIQIILHKDKGSTFIFDSSDQLLPLAFEEDNLK